MAEWADNMRYENASYDDQDGRASRKAKTKPASRKLALFLWGLVFLSLSGAGVVWFGSGSEQDHSELAVLRPDPGPLKVKPIEPGGLDIETSNTTVLDMLDGNSPRSKSTETLALPDGEPELPPVQTAASDSSGTSSVAQDTRSDATPATTQTADVTPTVTAPTAAQDMMLPENSISDGTQTIEAKRLLSDGDTLTSKPDSQTRPLTDETSEVASPTARPKRDKRVIKKQIIEPDLSNPDLFMVQLAAFRNREKAETASALLTEKHNKRLMGLTLGVMQVAAKNSTMFWRVITEPIPPKDARKICGDLKRSGQDCILRKATPVRP